MAHPYVDYAYEGFDKRYAASFAWMSVRESATTRCGSGYCIVCYLLTYFIGARHVVT